MLLKLLITLNTIFVNDAGIAERLGVLMGISIKFSQNPFGATILLLLELIRFGYMKQDTIKFSWMAPQIQFFLQSLRPLFLGLQRDQMLKEMSLVDGSIYIESSQICYRQEP